MSIGIIVKTLIDNPWKIVRILADKKFFNWIPDKQFLKIIYYAEMRQKLNLVKPVKYTEKIQWLKLYNRRPEYCIYVDKYDVREYIRKNIGEQYLIPLISVYNSADEIEWEKLPNKFVLKCSHGSGGKSIFICRDKSNIDISKAKKLLSKAMKHSWFWFGREWPYKNQKPKIVCENFLETENGLQPVDYKFYCFNGKPDSVMVCLGRGSGSTKFYFFDREWKLLKYNKLGKEANPDFTIEKPKNIDRMFEIAEKLSKDIPFVRVDLYSVQEKVYFGELTLFPTSGFAPNLLEETNKLFGEKIELPDKKTTEIN